MNTVIVYFLIYCFKHNKCISCITLFGRARQHWGQNTLGRSQVSYASHWFCHRQTISVFHCCCNNLHLKRKTIFIYKKVFLSFSFLFQMSLFIQSNTSIKVQPFIIVCVIEDLAKDPRVYSVQKTHFFRIFVGFWISSKSWKKCVSYILVVAVS